HRAEGPGPPAAPPPPPGPPHEAARVADDAPARADPHARRDRLHPPGGRPGPEAGHGLLRVPLPEARRRPAGLPAVGRIHSSTPHPIPPHVGGGKRCCPVSSALQVTHAPARLRSILS